MAISCSQQPTCSAPCSWCELILSLALLCPYWREVIPLHAPRPRFGARAMEKEATFPNRGSTSEDRQSRFPNRNVFRGPVGGIQKRRMRIVRIRAGHGWVRGTERWIRVRFNEQDELYVPDSEEDEEQREATAKEQAAGIAEVQVAAVADGQIFAVPDVLLAAVGDEQDSVVTEMHVAAVGDEEEAVVTEVEGVAVWDEPEAVLTDIEGAAVVEEMAADDAVVVEGAAFRYKQANDEAWMRMLKIYLPF